MWMWKHRLSILQFDDERANVLLNICAATHFAHSLWKKGFANLIVTTGKNKHFDFYEFCYKNPVLCISRPQENLPLLCSNENFFDWFYGIQICTKNILELFRYNKTYDAFLSHSLLSFYLLNPILNAKESKKRYNTYLKKYHYFTVEIFVIKQSFNFFRKISFTNKTRKGSSWENGVDFSFDLKRYFLM